MMPKYMLIGIGIPLIIVLITYLWSKLSDKSKNKILMLIFGIFFFSIFVLLYLLMN